MYGYRPRCRLIGINRDIDTAVDAVDFTGMGRGGGASVESPPRLPLNWL